MMIEVHPRLWVGDDNDAEDIRNTKEGLRSSGNFFGWKPWAMVSAAKEPYHRAMVGYTGRGAP